MSSRGPFQSEVLRVSAGKFCNSPVQDKLWYVSNTETRGQKPEKMVEG